MVASPQYAIRQSLSVVTAPTDEPVTLAEAKAHLRIDHLDEDVQLTDWIIAARAECENRTNRAFLTTAYKLTLDRFPDWEIVLPRAPLIAVSAMTYYDADGVQQSLGIGTRIVDTSHEPGLITPAFGTEWPSTQDRINAVEITYTAGYAATAAAWASSARKAESKLAKQAILLLVGHFWRHREAVITGTSSKEIELSIDAILASMKLPEAV